MSDRARQFLPFAALRGYYDLIAERERVTEPKRELSEEDAAQLSAKLLQVRKGMMVKVMYYSVDAYVTLEGMVAAMDPVFRTLTIVKTKIVFDDLLDIFGEDIVDPYLE